MTTENIILGFEQYVDDTTELSPAQELALANKIYRKILDAKPWEFLKKEFIGTTTGSTTVTLPADFKFMLPTYGYTDSTTDQGGLYVFIGSTLKPYKVVNWSDRKQYITTSQVCYLDIVNGNLVFTVAPDSGLTISFDYIYRPDDLALDTSPVFPAEYHPAIYHGMATEDYIIQQFDKARSYAAENQAMYKNYLADLGAYNSQLITINY